MSNYATNSDLLDYVPTIFEHGVEDFTSELSQATADVQREIETDWFNPRFSNDYDLFGRSTQVKMDVTKLQSAQWKRSTIYRALYAYILPRLSPFLPDGDAFQTQISFYKSRYNEEIKAEIEVGVEYDYNGDDTITDDEIYRVRQDRLYR